MIIMILLLVLLVLLVQIGSVKSDTIKLRSYDIHNSITVSGLSSGAFFAVQMHVSFSGLVNGSAVFAGGPFYCAESTLEYAEEKCMSTALGLPQVQKLVDLTISDYTLGYIDNPNNLKDDKIYLFSGKLDTVVDPKVVKSLQNYYDAFIHSSNIVADYNVEAEHCMPTLNYGEDCSTLSSPYIGNCNFDGAGKALQVLLGPGLTRGQANSSNLYAFDQTPYFEGSSSSIGDVGYIYIPSSCETKQCYLHISFHGCEQNLELIGNQYAVNSGYNDWAESNGIIVLYPYVQTSNPNPYNPNGCWDWWGYADNIMYGVKAGVQMSFVKKLIDTIKG